MRPARRPSTRASRRQPNNASGLRRELQRHATGAFMKMSSGAPHTSLAPTPSRRAVRWWTSPKDRPSRALRHARPRARRAGTSGRGRRQGPRAGSPEGDGSLRHLCDPSAMSSEECLPAGCVDDSAAAGIQWGSAGRTKPTDWRGRKAASGYGSHSEHATSGRSPAAATDVVPARSLSRLPQRRNGLERRPAGGRQRATRVNGMLRIESTPLRPRITSPPAGTPHLRDEAVSTTSYIVGG
jgi:hypothetical protein